MSMGVQAYVSNKNTIESSNPLILGIEVNINKVNPFPKGYNHIYQLCF